MVRKAKPNTRAADSQLAAAIRDSAQQIWLAGMGAFAKAREERTKIFDALVREGRGIQLRTRALAEESIGEVTGKVNDMKERATESWDRLEQVFENRVSRSLARLGVPTGKDIRALLERVDELTASVQELGGKAAAGPSARKAAPRKAGAKKAGAKKAGAKKAGAKKAGAKKAGAKKAGAKKAGAKKAGAKKVARAPGARAS